jgi:hypothetical protein
MKLDQNNIVFDQKKIKKEEKENNAHQNKCAGSRKKDNGNHKVIKHVSTNMIMGIRTCK